MPISAVLMNDTSVENHHGCRRVMTLLERHLRDRGISVVARSSVRHKWYRDRRFLNALKRCNLVVINGEGTLHHGRRGAKRLLEVVDHPACLDKKVVLLNALYQDNPSEWARYLDKIDLIAVRDQRSSEEIFHQTGREVLTVPDLSLSVSVAPANTVREWLLFGDSVLDPVTARLKEVARREPNGLFMPTATTPFPARLNYPEPLRSLHDGWNAMSRSLFNLAHARQKISPFEHEYLETLQASRLHITGRFHAVCFSLLTATPFIALRSNSWKIEALLAEAGLKRNRLIEMSQLEDVVQNADAHAFSTEENASVDRYLSDAIQRSEALFDQVAAIAGSGATR